MTSVGRQRVVVRVHGGEGTTDRDAQRGALRLRRASDQHQRQGQERGLAHRHLSAHAQ